MQKIKSFVFAMWPILGIMRLLGWFPFQRDKLELSFVWCLVSAVMLPLQFVPAYILIYNGLQAIPVLDPRFHLKAYVLVAVITVFQITAVLCSMCAIPHRNLCRNFNNFQISLTRNNISSTIQFDNVRRWSYIVPFFGVFSICFLLVIRPKIVGQPPMFTVDVYLPLSTMYTVLMLAWWRGVMRAVTECSRALVQHYKVTLHSTLMLTCLHGEQKRRLLAYRMLWLRLCRLLRDAGFAMTPPMIVFILLILALLVHTLYELMLLPELGPRLFYVFYSLLFFWGLNSLCHAGYIASKQVFNDITKAITMTEDSFVAPEIKEQMQDFFIHLQRQSPEVTLQGYVTVSRYLMAQVIPAMIANIIILVQFNIKQEKFETVSFFQFGGFMTYS